DLLDRQPVDAVVLDQHMPVMGGLEALLAIRASGPMRTLPVIMLTGAAEEADRIRGLDNGADDYIAKPVGPGELVARVRAQMRGREVMATELERARAGSKRLERRAPAPLPPESDGRRAFRAGAAHARRDGTLARGGGRVGRPTLPRPRRRVRAV